MADGAGRVIGAGRRAALLAVAVVGAALLGAFLPPAGTAAAGERRRADRHVFRDDWDRWDDYSRTLLQMQRERIASEEELAREAGRERRREELERSRAQDAAEREAYFDALLEASEASLRAPRGAFYRKPGYTSPEGPGTGAAPLEVDGTSYQYDEGVFWLRQGGSFIVVTAPAGAVVAAPPRGAVPVGGAGGALWYYFGTFFAEQDQGCVVVRPPAGVTVYYLPDGYLRERREGADVFRFGDTLFRPVFVQGILAYQVVGEP